MEKPLYECQTRLLKYWLLPTVVLGAVLLIQAYLGKYGGRYEEAFSWFFPHVMPTLVLMLGIVGQVTLDTTRRKEAQKTHVATGFYRLSFWVTAVHFFLLGSAIFVQPLTDWTPFEIFKISNFVLAFSQTIVSGSVVIFFVQGRKAQKEH